MRCLYCGKELALLKRLTGGGEFCSEAHKQSYQEEYNRLALSRLLQAQKKGKANIAPPSAAPPAAAVALEESAPEPQAETPAAPSQVEPSVAETLAAETAPEAAPVTSAEPEPHAGAEPEPINVAGFLPDLPAIVALSGEPQPYQEPWLELSSSPVLSEWQAENSGSFELSHANLQTLEAALNASPLPDPAPSADLPAPSFPSAQPNPVVSSPSVPSSVNATNRLSPCGPVAIQVAPTASDPASDQTFVHPLALEAAVLFGESELLDLAPAAIGFPPADADVEVLEARRERSPEIPAPDLPKEDTTPKSSLEALSRLHQEMIQEQDAQAPPQAAPSQAAISEDLPREAAAPVEIVAAVPPELSWPEQSSSAQLPAGAVTIEIVAEKPEQAEQESGPPCSTDILEISLRIFPPSKGTPQAGQLLPAATFPLLPHLKSLPLRPKVALAKGYTPGTPARTETPAPVAVPQRKPAPRPLQAKPPGPPPKPAPAAAKSASVPASRTEPAKPAAAPPIEKASPTPPAAPVAEAPAPEIKAPEVKAPELKSAEVKKPEPVSKPVEAPLPAAQKKPEPANPQSVKSESPKPQPAREPARPEPVRYAAATTQDVPREDVPSFGIAQPGNLPWYSSLKVKLGIAILLLVIACVYFLGWGGKSHPPASSNTASGDGSGPSIIMGEGGWVEGWGGDPSGLHVGREITIYRPSLKLSDYRIEFQGTIDVKSIGWVFRAADPQNYYAMKIATVSSALPLKVALFKYLVANGRQTQVGRVPIDMAIQPDTVFNVREDVRGPHFTTYIQGQQIDSWTDDQLKVGGVGILNEREERGKVSSVSIRYLTGGK